VTDGPWSTRARERAPGCRFFGPHDPNNPGPNPFTVGIPNPHGGWLYGTGFDMEHAAMWFCYSVLNDMEAGMALDDRRSG